MFCNRNSSVESAVMDEEERGDEVKEQRE